MLFDKNLHLIPLIDCIQLANRKRVYRRILGLFFCLTYASDFRSADSTFIIEAIWKTKTKKEQELPVCQM